MRRTLTAMCTMFSALTTIAGAQSVKSPTVGLLGGAAIFRLSDLDLRSTSLFNGTSKSKSNVGLQLGAFVRFPVNATWAVQPELHYVQKGTTLDFGGTGQAAGSLKAILSYVEVPLLVRAALSTTSAWRPFVVAGPSFAYRSGCKMTVTSGTTSLSVNCDAITGSPDPFKTSDVGAILGGGVEYVIGSRFIGAQARYSRGLVTVATQNTSSSGQSPKNSGFSLLFSIGM